MGFFSKIDEAINQMTAGSNQPEEIGVCDVHALLMGDSSPRPVKYCELCHAYICADCRSHWIGRAQAFFARKRAHYEQQHPHHAPAHLRLHPQLHPHPRPFVDVNKEGRR
jgi:hypothetical protein